MLTNGRSTPFTSNQTTHSPNQKSNNTSRNYTASTSNIAAIEQRQENGLISHKTNDRDLLDDLKRMSSINNNKKFWGSEMPTVNSPSPSLSNSNGYAMPMMGNSTKTGIDTPLSTSSRQQPSSSSLMNNQVGSNVLDNLNTNSNILSSRDQSISSPSSSSSSKFNSAYNSRQDILLQSLPRNSGHDINPMMHVGPNGTNEQYGSSQQRSYMSGPNESQVRGLSRQTRSPFPPNYFPQESHNNQTVSRPDNLQTEERSLSEHFQWPQASLPASSISSNPSIGIQNRNHSSMQSGMPSRQPPPYMMMGQALPPPSQSQSQYMMQSQMKANSMNNPYYTGMGNMMQRQQGMPNQMQKPSQDYGSFQQQQPYYSQPRYPSSLPPYMQSRQQSMPSNPANIQRMIPTQQPILPKPSMGDMYSRYSNSMTPDTGMDFQGPVMNDHMQQQQQQQQQQLRQQQPQQSFPSPGGLGPDVNHRGYYPGYANSPSPNVTMGSPLRTIPEGFPPNSGNMPGMGGTPSYPNTPPSSMPFSSGSSTQSNAAVAAAAAVMQAANSRFPPNMGHQPTEQSTHGYSSHDNMAVSRGRISGSNTMPSSCIPGMDTSSPGNAMETGQVGSPTLNMLPTAEDVEAMIQSMSSEGTCMDDSGSQSQSCPPSVPTSTGKPEMANDSVGADSASPSTQNVKPTNADDTSPISPFAEEFSGVPSPGVSISSFCGDNNDDMNVPVDDITPTLGQTAITTNDNVEVNKQTNKDSQFGKYSQLYELSNEPERKEFLDRYSTFMESTGNTVKQVPVFNSQILDIYKLYKVIKDNGGLQEVVKRKLWDKVLISLNISPEQTVLSNQLRNHYSRFLLAYEMSDVTRNTHNATVVDNLLDDAGIPPPNATVTCSEVLFPAPTMSLSNQSSITHPTGYGQQPLPQPLPQPQPQPPIVNGPQGYSGGGGYNFNEGYMPDNAQYDKGYPVNTSYNMPQYPVYGNNYPPNYRGYPQPQPQPPPQPPQQPYPGSAALSQLLHQRSQGIGGYPPPAMMAQPRPQPDMPMWSQYKASTEPEHMVDYHPKQPYSSNRQPFPQTPPQYRQSPPPLGARSPSLPRQPVAPTHPVPVPSQVIRPKFQANHVKKEIFFPMDSVEATKPIFTKKRKLTSRDLGPVEAWRVMMSLKSGLLTETTWALDALNILLYDDHTVGYFLLSQLPGLLDNLLDHFRRYLVEIFGPFWEEGYEEEEPKDDSKKDAHVKKEKSEEDKKLEQDVSRSLTGFLAASAIDYDNDLVDEWWLDTSKSALHIQTQLGNVAGQKRRKQHDFRQAETKCKLKLCAPIMENMEITHVNIKTEPTTQEIVTQHNDSLKTVTQGVTPNSVTQDAESVSKDVSPTVTSNSVTHNKSSKSVTPENAPSKTDPQENMNAEKVKKVKSEGVKTEDVKTNCDGNHCDKRQEKCALPVVATGNEWDLDSEDSTAEESNQPITTLGDFTARLQRELDLDIEQTDDSDTNDYIQTLIDTRAKQSKNSTLLEEESIRTEESTLSLRTESDVALSRRVMCVSNILRGLSFVPGNDVEMFRHPGLLLILGKILLLYHHHGARVPYRHSFMQDDLDIDAPSDDQHDWWWSALEVLRENAFVIFSNIAGHLDLSVYPRSITMPILDGLLHWFVCQSAEAIDPMPTASANSSLSAQQLVLEALAKMSILGGNTELILTSQSSRLEALYATLIRLLGHRDNPVSRELSLVVLSNLTQSDNEYVCLIDKKQCIAMLLQFIEDAANSINAYSSGGSLAQAGFHSEDFCGTSVDMLRRAASSLICLARSKPIRSLFLPYQERLLLLTTLKLLERMIGPQLADVLYYLSR